MAQYHLRYDDSENFPRWAALQLIPSMYNFSNELWYANQPIDVVVSTGASLASVASVASPGVQHRFINHYPLRFVSFGFYRKLFLSGESESFIYLRSRYRDQEMVTQYQIIPGRASGPDGQIYLKRF